MRLFRNPLPYPITDCYFSAFLTQACNYNCPYCRQKFNLTTPQNPIHEKRDIPMYPISSGKEWVRAINEIEEPIPSFHIQGGEPSLHPDFFEILNGVKFRLTMDTNLTFDAERFVREVKGSVSIYTTFHPTQAEVELFATNFHTLKSAGFKVYPSIIPDPYNPELVEGSFRALVNRGLPMSKSGYIGWVNGKLSPPYRDDPYRNKDKTSVLCLCKEVLFAPDGTVYNCPAKLDRRCENTYGNIFKGEVDMPTDYILCQEYGFCNPCSEHYTAYKEDSCKEYR